jgi:magnesium chelatase family protein
MADLSDDVKNKLNALQTKLGQDSQELIRVAMSELNLSARTYDRILKVSRTIADLEGKTAPSSTLAKRSNIGPSIARSGFRTAM